MCHNLIFMTSLARMICVQIMFSAWQSKDHSISFPCPSLLLKMILEQQPKNYVFHDGSRFYATLFSVNLILFLLVLRLLRSQWAFFGMKNRVTGHAIAMRTLHPCHWQRQLLKECISHPYCGTGIIASVSWSWWFTADCQQWLSLGERDTVQNKNGLNYVDFGLDYMLKAKGLLYSWWFCRWWITFVITLNALPLYGWIIFSCRFYLSTNTNVRLGILFPLM